MRIAVGGIEHETCGFAAPSLTAEAPTLMSEARVWKYGEELRSLGDANTIVDGLVRGVRESGHELVPLLWIDANTSPPVTRESLECAIEDLLDRLRKALPVDGVLLSLHGAFAAQGVDDADGEVLSRVRELVGPKVPLMAVHDLHCNISPVMERAASVLVVERTYPHVDMAERAVHAARIMARTVTGEVRPTMAVRFLPLLWSAARMIDAEPPMSDAVGKLRELDQRPGVLSASIGVGYQWIDNPTVGTSVIVVTDNDEELARRNADELAEWLWDRRSQWQREPLPPELALDQGEQRGKYPIVFADQGDNTGGGAAGDATEMLRLFIERKLVPSAVLYMVDPDVAAQAVSAGAGAEIDILIGGKSQPLVGPPVSMRVRVRAVSNGQFTYDGPMWAGVVGEMGPSAWLEQDGVHVVVISGRHQPVDLAFCRSLGLDCRPMRYLAVKSTGHFRSGFAPIAGSIFNVDTASALSHDFRRLPYTRLGRRMFPIDPNVSWTGERQTESQP
ncbi:MAG: M81 family metallopeptidase [Planctomycetaceae bacterium]|nr:M81 family metallopeptidase [Planctomycetaceae bacterium]